jgi:hypothetical protein
VARYRALGSRTRGKARSRWLKRFRACGARGFNLDASGRSRPRGCASASRRTGNFPHRDRHPQAERDPEPIAPKLAERALIAEPKVFELLSRLHALLRPSATSRITLRLRHRIADDAETPSHAPVSITTQCRKLTQAQPRAVVWLLSPTPNPMERPGDRPPTDTHPVSACNRVVRQVAP